MKQRKWLSILVAMALCCGLLPMPVLAEEPVPTRTETLDVSDFTETTDMLEEEGWKWEPTADGGTLTLQNCYIRTDSVNIVQFPADKLNVRIVLEGNNTLETTSTVYGAMFGSGSMGNYTISGASDSKLNLICAYPETPAISMPYGIAGNSVTLESGNVYCNTCLTVIKKDVNIQGGSLTIDAAETFQDGIYTNQGNVTISGGTVDIKAGRVGIFVPGILDEGEQTVNIIGGDVTIKAENLGYTDGNCFGIGAKHINIATDGIADIHGRDVAIVIWKDNGSLIISKTGDRFSLTNLEEYGFPAIYTSKKDVTIEIADADYSKVEEAIAKAEGLNPNDYKDFSAVTAAIEAVVWDKDVTEQAAVNAMAAAIEEAIAGLQKKSSSSTPPSIPTYYVNFIVGEHGSVTPGSGMYEIGSKQTFTITPDSGYEVDQVLVDGKAVYVHNNQFTLTVDAPYRITVQFAEKAAKQPGIDVSAPGSGSTTATPNPQTGDSLPVGMLAALTLAAGSLIVLRKRVK